MALIELTNVGDMILENQPLMDLPNQIIPTMIKLGEHPASTAGHAEITIDVQYLPSEKVSSRICQYH